MSLQNIIENWSSYRKGAEQGGHHNYEHLWGMVIDLNKCTGCGACVTACYAENNLAVVGHEKYSRNLGMNWLRIERYWDEPDLGEESVAEYQHHGASFLPMHCQHCSSATCEPVCPVAATYHTPDGLNAQVYNRCVGSRYCSNNCPYRLRYFNFYSYYEESWPAPLHMQLNPDLTVRDKGVMEKCTFCVQRIRTAKDTARRERRKVRDGEFTTACAQTCPTSAMTFGDLLTLHTPGGGVGETEAASLWKKHQVELGKSRQQKQNPELRGYRVFEGLNTDPRVLFLERVREV
ncbi:MAG: 4Fe-4S dicluster domain-containing protein [Chromatiales bacterium]|jgi:molybdopterin-containing oxidoreductase family iron-sulfur binding subunit|nr:4Fe-4S dicluster domain-containing protein [Chromatiales bacterium]